jgi:hypothetical protein
MKEICCDPYLYAVMNSGLDAGENALYYHFAPVIENASSLREYIEGVLENKRGKAIGCEKVITVYGFKLTAYLKFNKLIF